MQTVASLAKHRGAQGNQRSVSSSSEGVSQRVGCGFDRRGNVFGSIRSGIGRGRGGRGGGGGVSLRDDVEEAGGGAAAVVA